MRIGFVQTALTVSEADSGVGLEVRVLEGVLSPQLGNVPVTVSTNDVSASGELTPLPSLHSVILASPTESQMDLTMPDLRRRSRSTLEILVSPSACPS